jgi:hypothetical protein
MTTTPTSPAESDPFFHLLTEALRAGPGSPQWGEAVAKLRDGGVEGADEYRLIIRAREDIELGRDYRKVSAGAEFTRKVLNAVEREGKRSSGVPTATIVAVLAGLVILAVIITVIVIMSRGGADADRSAQQHAIEHLDAVNFASNVSTARFSGAVPEGWRVVGPLPLSTVDGLRAGESARGAKPTVGGVVSADALPADQPFALDTELELPENDTGGPVQVFVSDAPDFSQNPAGAREVVLTIRDEHAMLEVAGKSIALPGTIRATPKGSSTLKVSLRLDRNVMIADVGGRRIYAGPHGLPADKPRYAGVRFVRAGETVESATVRSITISRVANSSSPSSSAKTSSSSGAGAH